MIKAYVPCFSRVLLKYLLSYRVSCSKSNTVIVSPIAKMSPTATDKPISDSPTASVDYNDFGPGTVKDIRDNEDEDDATLRANGHDQSMPRQFSWVSALGLGFSITNSWVGYLVGR